MTTNDHPTEPVADVDTTQGVDQLQPVPVQEPADQEPADQQPDEDQADDEGAHKEAARYRRRLREAERQRDALSGQVEGLQRTEAERLAADHLAKPAGLWAAGVQLGDLVDESGGVDPEKVREAALQAADQLGLQTPKPANHVAGEGGNPRPSRSAQDDMLRVVMGG